MKAMVLAAGKGTRLLPFTADRPKPMMPVAGRPLLDHIIGQIRSAGIADIFINLHHQPEIIRSHFGDGRRFGVRITYSLEPDLLGTAGAVKKLASHFTETFLVYYGDNYVEMDIPHFIQTHRDSKADATIAIFPCANPHLSGIVQIDDRRNIVKFVEKPEDAAGLGNLANAGVYALEPRILPFIPADRPADFGRDIFPSVLNQNCMCRAYTLQGNVIGIDTPESLARLESYLSQKEKTAE